MSRQAVLTLAPTAAAAEFHCSVRLEPSDLSVSIQILSQEIKTSLAEDTHTTGINDAAVEVCCVRWFIVDNPSCRCWHVAAGFTVTLKINT